MEDHKKHQADKKEHKYYCQHHDCGWLDVQNQGKSDHEFFLPDGMFIDKDRGSLKIGIYADRVKHV
ncbi:MAG: hypothetical protein PVH19_09960, partial [Planctomycetia bacterium]